MSSVRLAHFSDVHLSARRLGWTRRNMFGKQTTGWMNVKLLGRGRRFRHAPAAAAALAADFTARPFDHLIFSGDASTLGFEAEFAAAAAALRVTDPAAPPGFAVPGNHDYYTVRGVLAGYFETHFRPWQAGVRIDDHLYPFARKVGHVWLIGLNTATVNLWPWDASGAAGEAQLARLRKLCDKLDPGPRILVTHYPLRSSHGLLEVRTHRLRDHRAALNAAADCGVSLWLHGHIHRGYVLPAGGDIPFPVICGGSATQTRRWMYHDYTITGNDLTGVRRVFDPIAGAYADRTAFAFPLRA